MTLINNYDEAIELTSIDEAMEFFAEHDANETDVLVLVGRALDKEFSSWVKFTYDSAPRTDEQWIAAEAEFLQETYKNLQGIERAFNLVWPHKIDE